jgi:hypothetical protein
MNNINIEELSSNTVYLYYNNIKELTAEEKYFNNLLKKVVHNLVIDEPKNILEKWEGEWKSRKKNYKKKYNRSFEYWVSRRYYCRYELYYYLKEYLTNM